jgi:hypothetical protein
MAKQEKLALMIVIALALFAGGWVIWWTKPPKLIIIERTKLSVRKCKLCKYKPLDRELPDKVTVYINGKEVENKRR